MSVCAKASIRLKFNDSKQLSTILNAIKPETQTMQTTRASVKLEKDDNYLLLSVEAEDTTALRATLNAYLRWINSTLNVIDVVKKV